MRYLSYFLLSLMLLSLTSCMHRYPDPEGSDGRAMMSQSVKISVNIIGVRLHRDADGVVHRSSEAYGWTGSGVVVDVNKGTRESLVMSAAHVTHVKPVYAAEDTQNGRSTFLVLAALWTVETLDGTKCKAAEIYADVPHDLGVLKVDCIAGEKAYLADSLPPAGALVSTSGAALGFHDPGSFIVTDGRYVGLEAAREEADPGVIVTLPGAPGHSGSGLFYQGKVFGILTRGSDRFEHIILGTDLKYLKVALEVATRNWK